MLPSWVEDYVGLPYKPGGRTRDGIDCWGLIALIHKERLGRPLPDYDGPLWTGGNTRTLADAAADYSSQFVRIIPGQEWLGDGILLRTAAHPVHVGMVLFSGYMIHIEATADSCVERYDRPRWASRIAGFYRYI